MFYQISAGSSYGRRVAIYEVVENVLVLRDNGEDDNLSGNRIALDFEGLTITQAEEKVKAENSEGSGHSYDGCHACKFSVSMDECKNIPDHLTYHEPVEAKIIKQALAQFRAAA